MRITDSHAHYDDSAFDSDRYLLLNRLFSEDVELIINVGCSLKGSADCRALADRYEGIYFSAGLHPDAADEYTRLSEIEQLLFHKKAVAVGEIGLDYHYENHDRTIQKKAFEAQLELARRLDLPVIIHSRDAWEDTMELLRRYRPRGVMHCFSGSAEIAQEVTAMGMYIGFTGAVTFKNSKKARRALEAIPVDRLLVETDCPYMSPEPLRGQRSDSSMIKHTLETFAAVKGLSAEDMARITAENTRRLFYIERKQ